ncbi:hypothetical protein AB0H36_14235 [Kribbella sp. NPDC050820]|uniref:hypothetical protein n=1 Tax=Kribbella sp. NPDC050820 TaxID=3155408 RepID=UPI0033DE295A
MGAEATNRHWRTMSVTTGIAGLAGIVLVAASQALLLAGASEPDFDAPAAEIVTFFEAQNETATEAGAFLGQLALLAIAWFVVGVWAVLRHAEGDPAWRSAAALVSGVVFVALVMTGGWQLATFRLADGVDPQLARLAFDMGNLGFANGWLALGSFLLAAGWIFLTAGSLPNWLGWLALAAALGFVVGRAFWTTAIWLIPYSLFWIWTIAVSVQLLRGRMRSAPSQAQFDRLGRGME